MSHVWGTCCMPTRCLGKARDSFLKRDRFLKRAARNASYLTHMSHTRETWRELRAMHHVSHTRPITLSISLSHTHTLSLTHSHTHTHAHTQEMLRAGGRERIDENSEKSIEAHYFQQEPRQLLDSYHRQQQQYDDTKSESQKVIYSVYHIYIQYCGVSLYAPRVHRACRGQGLQHLLGATKRAFLLFYIFWNSDYRQRFPLKLLKSEHTEYNLLVYWSFLSGLCTPPVVSVYCIYITHHYCLGLITPPVVSVYCIHITHYTCTRYKRE